MKRIWALILAIVMVAAFTAACGNNQQPASNPGESNEANSPPPTGNETSASPSPSTNPGSQGTVDLGNSGQVSGAPPPPTEWNPVHIKANFDSISLGGMDVHVAHGISVQHWVLCYEALLAIDKNTLKPEPSLAESYTISDDQLVYTFNIKKGVQFHHGYGELTAHDFVFGMERVRDEPLAQAGMKTNFNTQVKEFRAIDDYTLEITLNNPFPDFIFSLTQATYYGISRVGFEDIGAEKFNEYDLGTGKFVFDPESWIPGQEATFLAFEDYWGDRANVHVTMTEIKDGNAAFLAMQAGEMDFILTSQLEVLQQAEAWGARVEIMKAPFMFGIFFNGNLYEPFKNPRVKEALCMALNRDFTRMSVFGEHMARQAVGVLPELAEGWIGTEDGLSHMAAIEYNPERAKEILKEEGYENALEFTATVQNNVRNERIFTLIQQQFKEIGVTMHINMLSTVEALQGIQDRTIEFGYSSMSATSSIYQMTYSFYRGDSVNNATGYNGIDELISLAGVTPNGPERNEIYRQMQLRIDEDFVFFPHHFTNVPMICQPNLYGVFSKGQLGGDAWFTEAYVVNN